MGNEAWLAVIISLAMAVGFFLIGFYAGRKSAFREAKEAIREAVEELKKEMRGENGARD